MYRSPLKHSLSFAFAVVIAMTVWTCASMAQTDATAPPEPQPSAKETTQIDNYMTNHPAVANELHNNPSLVNDPTWLAKHPELHNYMNNHPGIQKAAAANPASVVNRADRSTLGRDHADLNKSDSYLAHHPEIKEQLTKNPKLIDDPKYLAEHPGLDKELATHPEIRNEAMAHPEDFKKASEANAQYNKNQAKKKK
jgi:hypothetical protein